MIRGLNGALCLNNDHSMQRISCNLPIEMTIMSSLDMFLRSSGPCRDSNLLFSPLTQYTNLVNGSCTCRGILALFLT